MVLKHLYRNIWSASSSKYPRWKPSNLKSEGNWSLKYVSRSSFLNKIYFIYSKGRVRDREREAIHWFTPQKASTARSVPSWSKEPGASSGSPTWVAGAQGLWPSSAAILGTSARSWIGSKVTRSWNDTHNGFQGCRQQLNMLRHNAGPSGFTLNSFSTSNHRMSQTDTPLLRWTQLNHSKPKTAQPSLKKKKKKVATARLLLLGTKVCG